MSTNDSYESPQAAATKGSSGDDGSQEKSFFGIIVHSFFIIPFLIAVFCVLLFTAVNLLTHERRDAYAFLEDIKTGGLTKRWQGAFELSKVLANPKSVPHDEKFTDELIRAFKQSQHDDDRVRQYLALAMGRTGNPVFVPPLVEALKSEKQGNVAALIYALGMLKDKGAVSALYPYLEHPEARIRSIAVVALGNIGDPASIAALHKALHDSEPNVQWGAAVSLARMGDAAGADVLSKMLNRPYYAQFPEVDQEEQNNLVLTAMEAAAALNVPELKERIQELAQGDPNFKIRTVASKLLK